MPRGPARRTDWQETFLDRLTLGESVSDAAAVAGVDRQVCYAHRKRDAAFAEQWQEARDILVDNLESIAFERAKKNNTLMMFLLKAHRPSVYDRATEVKHLHGGAVKYEVQFKPPPALASRTIDAVYEVQGEHEKHQGDEGNLIAPVSEVSDE